VGDAIFNDPRLVRVYDAIEGDRRDLEVYVQLVDELGARSVLDIGCGTGTFACLLANRGVEVVAVDPACASLEIARKKPGAEAVRWRHGDATTLPPLAMDAAFMTGNVAQVFLTDEDWAATLRATRDALRPGGHLVFETRDPARRAWERWTPELTRSVLDVPGVGVVEDWGELTDVAGQFVSFRSTTVFRNDDLVIGSTSTLRFRDRLEIEDSLVAAGFQTVEIRDAPDRPGLEFVFIAVRLPDPDQPV
jgi:SAM-dependent methyltransferase